MRGQQGFTLIELLIVIVIIGVLALFAVPQFQARTASAQVSRVVMETSQLRTAIDLCVMQGINDVANCDIGATKSDLIENDGKPVIEMTKSATAKNLATITATFGNNASTVLSGKKVTWELSRTDGWACTSNVEEKYATKGCGKAAATTASTGNGS